MADEIGVADGELVAMSKGLHIYEYCWELARIAARISEDSEDAPSV
jgi:thymidylate synthase